MAEEIKYKQRPTRKVIRKMRMPASAKLGGYEVPEEATWEDIEELNSHMEVDPITGEPYAPRGLEESELGPELLLPAVGPAARAGAGAVQKGVSILGRKAGQSAARQAETSAAKALPKLTAQEAAEDLETFMSGIKRVKPELGTSKEPSPVRKFIDKTTDQYREWRDNLPANRRKLQKQLDDLQEAREAELSRIRKLEMDEMKRQERIRQAEGKEVPPTSINFPPENNT